MLKEWARTNPLIKPGETAYEYAALESLAEFRRLAQDASIIIAVDSNGTDQNIVYGREVLRAIASEVVPSQRIQVLRLVVDYRTDQVEHLIAAVRTVKGFDEWDSYRPRGESDRTTFGSRQTALRIVDGSRFWNPSEGLMVAANLLRFALEQIQSDRLKTSLPKEEVVPRFKRLDTQARAIRPLVKESLREWHAVHNGQRREPNPVRLKNPDQEVVVELRGQLEALQQSIMNSGGSVRLTDMAITFPTAEIRFTMESYFDFALRSLDEILELGRTGKLIGPTPDQSW